MGSTLHSATLWPARDPVTLGEAQAPGHISLNTTELQHPWIAWPQEWALHCPFLLLTGPVTWIWGRRGKVGGCPEGWA